MEKEFNNALRKRIRETGSEVKLSKVCGVSQSKINRIKNNSVPIDNLRLGTVRKLFPDMRIDFLGTGGKKSMEGKIIAMIGKLTPEERNDLALAIAAKYKHSVEEKLD